MIKLTGCANRLPLFARRFNEFGAGVEALGTSDMAFALTSMLAAPFMGTLADRATARQPGYANLVPVCHAAAVAPVQAGESSDGGGYAP